MNFKKIKNNMSFLFYPFVWRRTSQLRKQISSLNKEKYIAFMLFWKMGDIILSTRIVHEIKKKNPSAKICYITSESFKFAIKDNPEVDKIMTVKIYKENSFFEILNRPLWFLSRRIVEKSKNFSKRYFLQINPEYLEDLNKYDKHLMDLYAKKANIKLSAKNPFFITKESNKKYFKELCKNTQLKKKEYVVVGHVASAEGKTWPIENFEMLGKKILKKNPNLKIVFIGAKEDKYPLDKRFILIKGESLGNVAETIKNSKFFIGVDSGLIHLSSAFNQPIFGLYSDYAPITLSSPISKNLTLIKTNNLKDLKVSQVFEKIKNKL